MTFLNIASVPDTVLSNLHFSSAAAWDRYYGYLHFTKGEIKVERGHD